MATYDSFAAPEPTGTHSPPPQATSPKPAEPVLPMDEAASEASDNTERKETK